MALPRFIIVKSSDNMYLRYVEDVGPYHACLRFTELVDDDENVEIQYLKFEVVYAKSGEGAGLVHIRNCYNNKYFVRKSSESNLIVGEADEAEEDQSKWSCTLFKPVFVDSIDEDAFVSQDEPQKIRLLHIDQLGERYVSVSKSKGVDDEEGFNLVADTNQGDESSLTNDDAGDAFTVVDVTSLVILPDYVSFKGHNEQYCAITTLNGNPYLEFKTDYFGTTGAIHMVASYPQTQTIRVTNKSNNNHWALTSPYILANSGTSTSLFPIRLTGNNIAIRSLGNSKLLNCAAGQGMAHVLGASSNEVNASSTFEVTEPVLVREISNIVYNLADARIYNAGVYDAFEDYRDNRSDQPSSGSLGVDYKKSHTARWSNSVSITTGLSATMSLKIPYVGEFGFDFSREETKTREWGEETTEEETITFDQVLNLPPRKRITLLVVASRASCDIPFTCDVHDTMTDGTIREYTLTDGLYVGSNNYNFYTRIIQSDLPSLEAESVE